MKLQELRNLIRNEVRKAINESTNTLITLEDALSTNPDYKIIAIKDTVIGDKKDIIISKSTRDNLSKKGYAPIGIGKGFNASAESIEYIQTRIDNILKTPNYTIKPDILKAWKLDPVKTYLTTGIEYGQIKHGYPTADGLGHFGEFGGYLARPYPLYMGSNGINTTGEDNGKLIGFIFGITKKSITPVK